ncbi:MAG: hypothetical protein M3Z23_02950 [Acidobacteriota bacterium]|nr:hypothetical protein [Acidobacteriota bacterium]
MDLNKVIRDLYEEKKRLDQIISSLEQIQSMEVEDPNRTERRRGRKSMDPQARQEVSDRMKMYWALRRQNGNGGAKQVTNGVQNQQL